MRPVRSHVVAFFLAALAGACTAEERRFEEGPPSVVEPKTVAIAFDPPGMLALGVGQSATVSFVASPVPDTPLYVALRGDAADASLDKSVVPLDAEGRGKVTLFAPSRAGSFEIVASVDGAGTAARPVSVSGGGTAKLLVVPQYAGKRALGDLFVSVRAGERCSDHPEMPIADGPSVQKTTLGTPATLEGVPLGPTSLVTVRSGATAAGCIDVNGLHLDETRTVIVGLVDAPMRIAPVKLQLSLAIVPEPEAWPLTLSVWKTRFVAALFGGETKLPAALLDTMATALPVGEALAFQAARKKAGWDASLAPVLAPADVVSKSWVPAGVSRLLTTPGTVTGTLSSGSTSMGFAVLVPDQVLGVSSKAFALEPKKVTWSTASEGSDTVVAGGSVAVPPSRVLAAAIEATLVEDGAKSAKDALASVISCEAVTSVLVATGNAFGTCGATCVKALCDGAVATLWERAASSDEHAGRTLSLAFSLSASAEVDADASLLSFQGAWTGSMTESGPAPLGGKVSAKGQATGVP